MSEEKIKQRVEFFEKHLANLIANQRNLEYSFVEQEKISIKKVIDDLKSKI